MANREVIEELLGRFEQLEDPFVSWGVVGTTLSDDDVDHVLEEWLEETRSDNDPLELLDDLRAAGLLVKVDGGYRTRIGQFLWEIANLRQLFPKRDDPEGPPRNWRRAPTLVDGFRYTRRPREYPRRDRSPAPVMERTTNPASVEREVFRLLTSRTDGTPFDLAGFQERATETVLAQARDSRPTGAIVGAGTGSGKTLAFYLPAFTHMAQTLGDGERLRTLALYPRNELLKDQLQGGVEQAVRLATQLAAHVGRPLRVGALFGDVPQSVYSLAQDWHRSWRRRGSRRVCPYLACPGSSGQGCGGELSVDQGDRSDEPSLQCDTCHAELSADVFALTRAQLRRRPADLLFCSTEMLNRSLLDPSSAHVLGVDTRVGPDLVLLDEVHTYGGTSGAMTALALRRWRNRVRSAPAFVGLSATLLDAPRFFGDLVGLHADQVVDVRPDLDELIPEGAEYQLVLRGDPTSGAGLLSTTIQSSMLLARAMDPPGDSRSHGLFGKKVFVFTDDLDVTNRLYFDVLDAEGQRHRSGGGFPYKPSLAHLRSPAHDDAAARRRAGQVWDLALATGHDLGVTDRLRVARTSSQDAGLDLGAQVVVATASLEVGVDDPGVGAVIQHKAPRDNAAFLQRQGRAGRERGTRPVTTVVLSDYGRDRETFEAWDQLLSPLLRPASLPVRNVHVLRMQAVLATLGWATMRSRDVVGKTNLWTVLSRPPRNDRELAAQRAIAQELRSVLTNDDARHQLIAHLQSALDIERSSVVSLLWEPPRPLLLGAIPALLRRIHDGWRVARPNETQEEFREDHGARQPLPEFVPPTLFSPLALPEVLVELPAPTGADPAKDRPLEPMGLVQGLRELAPGRVTKRFAIAHDLDRAWVPVEPGAETVDISTFVELFQRDGEIGGLDVLRPLRITTQQPASQLANSSNGRPNWVSDIRPRSDGVRLIVPDIEPLGMLLSDFDAFLHRDQRQVEVLRGVISSDVSLLFTDGREERSTVALLQDGKPVLLGGAFDVDALRFRVHVSAPADVWHGARGPELRTTYFRDELAVRLRGLVNPFLGMWVHDVVSSALLREAIEHDRSIEDAWKAVAGGLAERLDDTLQLLFSTTELDLGDNDSPATPGKLRQRLAAALHLPDVLDVLEDVVPVLWRDPDAKAEEWLQRRIVRTVGEVIRSGAALLCPEHDPESVVLDVTEAKEGHHEIWISEQTVGGGGFVEAVVDACAAEPDRLFRLGRASLRHGSQELVAWALATVVDDAVQEGPTSAAFARYRDASDIENRAAALREVRGVLKESGIPATPDVIGAVVNRLLRVGSGSQLDQTVADSVQRWVSAEERLGVEVPVRTWTFLDSTTAGQVDADRLDRLQMVLWPRGAAPRNRRLASYNPFSSEPDPAPSVLQEVLATAPIGRVRQSDAETTWQAVTEGLRRDGVVRLEADDRRRRDAMDTLARSATDPVVLEHLRVNARVTEIDIPADGGLHATIELPLIGRWRTGEALQEGGEPIRSRRVMTSGQGRMSDVEELHHLFFLLELVAPSSPLWIVSAWLSDLAVMDNRGGQLLALAPGLPTRRLGIVEVLTELVGKGADVRVVVREDEHNRTVVGQLQQLSRRTTAGSISVEIRRDLHDKLIASERLLIEGSMNLTHRGSMRNEEGMRIVTDAADIATQRRELDRRFGGSGR